MFRAFENWNFDIVSSFEIRISDLKMITKKAIMNKLYDVLDPELGISIVDLGLVYEVTVDHNDVEILMTLTTIGCPLFTTIEDEVKSKVSKIKGIGGISINLTFDPPWEPEKMSEDAKIQLGFA